MKEIKKHHCLNFSDTTWGLLEKLAAEKSELLEVDISISSLIALWAKQKTNE